MTATKIVAKIYSLPDCHKCEELKTYLNENLIPFEAKWFDSESQTDFVMRNIFGNPPILEIDDRCLAAEEMFPGGMLSEDVVRDLLNVKEK